jgi:hypothetical protein
MIVNEPKSKVDLTKYVERHQFNFDEVLDDQVSNDLVYRKTVQPLVHTLFRNGKASCFAYGQTGSGKTYTMSPLPIRAAADIFKYLALPDLRDINLHVRWDAVRQGGDAGAGVAAARPSASAPIWAQRLSAPPPQTTPTPAPRSCFEIYGNKCFDLLNQRKKLNILEDGKRNVVVVRSRRLGLPCRLHAACMLRLCRRRRGARRCCVAGRQAQQRPGTRFRPPQPWPAGTPASCRLPLRPRQQHRPAGHHPTHPHMAGGLSTPPPPPHPPTHLGPCCRWASRSSSWTRWTRSRS